MILFVVTVLGLVVGAFGKERHSGASCAVSAGLFRQSMLQVITTVRGLVVGACVVGFDVVREVVTQCEERRLTPGWSRSLGCFIDFNI